MGLSCDKETVTPYPPLDPYTVRRNLVPVDMLGHGRIAEGLIVTFLMYY